MLRSGTSPEEHGQDEDAKNQSSAQVGLLKNEQDGHEDEQQRWDKGTHAGQIVVAIGQKAREHQHGRYLG